MRCCKRTGYLAILESAAFTKEMLGIEMELPEQVTCTHFPRNKQCLRNKCPFFPKNKEALEAQREREAALA